VAKNFSDRLECDVRKFKKKKRKFMMTGGSLKEIPLVSIIGELNRQIIFRSFNRWLFK